MTALMDDCRVALFEVFGTVVRICRKDRPPSNVR